MEEVKIGVYVCHCGTNIAGTVDVEEVAKYAATLPNVIVSHHYRGCPKTQYRSFDQKIA